MNDNMMITDVKNIRNLKRRRAGILKPASSERFPYDTVYTNLIEDAFQCYNNLLEFRRKRSRSKRYLEGDQWSELIYNPKDRFGNSLITEEEYIKRDGRIPFKQNIIAQLVNNIIGQYRKNPSKSNVMARAKDRQKVSEMLSNAIQSALKINNSEELDARNLREFVTSGFCAGKVTYEWDNMRKKNEVSIKNVSPNMMFFNTPISDPRVDNDLRIIGEFHDMTISEIYSAFAKTERDKKRIAEIFGTVRYDNIRHDYVNRGLTSQYHDNMDFYVPEDPNKFRVFEIWTYEYAWVTYIHDYANGSYTRTDYSEQDIAMFNEARIVEAAKAGIPPEEVALMVADRKYEGTWMVRYISATGYCLFETETPYSHSSHPYVLTLHPLMDGNVYGLVSIIIDQQRYINRLIALIDASIGASAKNMLAVPEESIPDNMDLQDFASEWSKVNGVVMYKSKNGTVMPKSISSNTVNMDANTILQLQLQLINQISGLNGAMQGQAPKSGTPSSLYAQQAENSSINIADLMAVFGSFKEKRDSKVLNVILQYYKEKRYLSVSGSSYMNTIDEFDPELAANADAELVVSTSTDTPVYRQLKDDFLLQLFMQQAIPVEILLENSSIQGSDIILEQLRKMKEQAQSSVQQQTAMIPQNNQQI